MDKRFEFRGGTKEEFRNELSELKELIDRYLKGEIESKVLRLKMFELAFYETPRKNTVLHPSEISYSFCKRYAYFKMLGIPEDEGFLRTVDKDLMLIFNHGTLVHLYIQSNMLRQGELDDFEVGFYDVKYNIGGSADGIKDDFVVELKTANSYVFSRLRAPYEEHIKQTSIYAKELGKKKIRIIYVDKNTLKQKVFEIEPDYDYLNGLFAELDSVRELKKRNFGLIKNVTREQVLSKPLPEGICKSRLEERALNCPYANLCFKPKK